VYRQEGVTGESVKDRGWGKDHTSKESFPHVTVGTDTPVQENPTQVVKLSTDSRVLATLFA